MSGRDTTRAALGMAWLFQRFRGTCPFSHHHSSRFRKPPSHPGRSDFPSPVGSSSFPQRTFPGLPRFKHSPAYTPWRQGYTSSSTPLEISTANLGTESRRCSRTVPATYREPLCPPRVLLGTGRGQPRPRKGVTLPSSLILAHAPHRNPLADFALAYTTSLCRLLRVPCWESVDPDVISIILA